MKEKLVQSAGGLLLGLLVGAALVSVPAFAADWKKIDAAAFVMNPPPAPGSSEDKEDFKKLHALEQTRTAEDCRLGIAQKHARFKVLWKDQEALLSRDEFDRAAKLMGEVDEWAGEIVDHFKETYKRPRPYKEDPTLNPCAEVQPTGRERKKSLAYPSGHATRGALEACLLAEVYPKRRTQLLRWGERIGDLRAVVGVHHPTDVVAGQKLAHDMCSKLISEPDFIRELKKINL